MPRLCFNQPEATPFLPVFILENFIGSFTKFIFQPSFIHCNLTTPKFTDLYFISKLQEFGFTLYHGHRSFLWIGGSEKGFVYFIIGYYELLNFDVFIALNFDFFYVGEIDFDIWFHECLYHTTRIPFSSSGPSEVAV